MRTTVNLDPDVLEVARSLAAVRGISLGAAISILARRGLAEDRVNANVAPGSGDRFPTFSVSENAPRFGNDDVKRALDDE